MTNINDSNQTDLAAQFNWKKRPSEIRGYHRTLYCTSDNNDYHRVDYNIKEKAARIYIEIADEGGAAYYTVIKDGKVTAEKSVSSGRTFGFSEKFRNRSDVFSTIPNREVIKLINSNYGIGSIPKRTRAKIERKKLIEETKKKYFQPEPEVSKGESKKDGLSFGELKFIDIVDFVIGLMLSVGSFYLFDYSYIAMGVVAAFFGIIIGLIDMLFRKRAPYFFKMIIFIIGGTASYLHGYFFT